MFEFFREHQRVLQAVLLLLIIPAFVLVGSLQYDRSGEKDPVLVNIAKFSIKQSDFANAKQQQLQRMQQMFGGQIDPALFESPEANAALLDSLVQEKLVQWAVEQQRLTSSDARLAEIIRDVSIFQEEGKFSPERYEQWLRSRKLTAKQFEQDVRLDIARSQVTAPIASSNTLMPWQQAQLLKVFEGQREIRQWVFKPEQYVHAVHIADEEIKKRYDESKQRFLQPASADIEYIVLQPEASFQSAVISDEAIQTFYSNNQQRFMEPEKRRARHILLAFKPDATASDKAALKQQAQTVLTELRANPGSFAEKAKSLSQDPGSAGQGGDLGFFTRDAMVKPFADTVYSMKQGQLSDVVETSFGFHLIELTDIQPAKVLPLVQAREQIVAELKKEAGDRDFADKSEKMTNLLFDQPDQFSTTAATLGLAVQRAAGVSSQPPVKPNAGAEAGDVLKHQAFLDALFDPELRHGQLNTKAIPVGKNLVAGRIVKYYPEQKKAFDLVKQDLRQELMREAALVKAQAEAKASLEAIQQGKPFAKDGWSKPMAVSRGQPAGLPSKALNAVFAVSEQGLPKVVLSEAGLDGSFLLEVLAVKAVAQPSNDAERAARHGLVARWQETLAQSEILALLGSLRQQAKVSVERPPVADQK